MHTNTHILYILHMNNNEFVNKLFVNKLHSKKYTMEVNETRKLSGY